MDHFTGAVALGFEQHRVHGAVGLQPSGPSLQRLGVGHLPTALIHPGVVAHVLPFKGQGLLAAAFEHAAQRRCHQ